ncbi:propionate catabolism operon regulatory protein PrpR [Achromobacter sp. Root83]|uniref:propionate catabolism operon regulatory protein PrpR n=1 Tax=Achromobacter sp. Root83 TaxID=1736602 RepID=UPI00070A78C6|nr:propionate catabolism operon regulatory protein PrpR [Achromobacter sp. Root83]KRC83351.1 propionate catabolism operon regulatory protein PrpR [Achromobacter sp. Root83]
MVYPTSPPGTALPRLCFLSYRQIREFAMPVVAEFTGRAHIEVVDGTFGGALAIARDMLERGAVDAFVSAGSNASILRAGLQAPVATIQLTGFDLLQVLIQARRIDDRVGVVMYGQTIPELDAIKDLLNIEIAQHAYLTPEHARQQFEQLWRENFRVIVGSSLVVELAEQAGLHGLLAYSLASVRKGFEDAIELARLARMEAGRYDQLNGVLHSLQDAVLAVDRGGRIIAVNPPMQSLLERDTAALIGQRLDQLRPELSLASTLDSGEPESGSPLRLGGRDWVANRTAIREHGRIVGAALALSDAGRIQEADTRLRVQQRRRQNTARYHFSELIGHSAELQRAITTARRYARTDLTVLIAGESGVGKELFAQAIHNDSQRADRPFVAINCASLPESLLESELFGHEEGAFTGSRRGGKRGLFEAAHTGTLFLDEIGDMPLPLQSRLLRVLQEREVTRLGATAAIPVDVRIIAATHQPLDDMVAQRRFRQDLYYRINTLRLAIPSLRERPADIPPLLETLLSRCMKRLDIRMDPGPLLVPWLPRLTRYAWPGNVRELENICERIAAFLLQYARAEDVDHDALRHDCPELFDPHAPSPDPHPATTQRERALQALHACGGNRLQAACRLGVSRSTLWRWMSARTPEA